MRSTQLSAAEGFNAHITGLFLIFMMIIIIMNKCFDVEGLSKPLQMHVAKSWETKFFCCFSQFVQLLDPM